MSARRWKVILVVVTNVFAREQLAATKAAAVAKRSGARVVLFNTFMAHPPPLTEVRDFCAEELATLPIALSTLEHVRYSPAKVSDRQHALVAELDSIAR